MVRNLIRNQAPGNRLRVRIPCPPLEFPHKTTSGASFAWSVRVGDSPSLTPRIGPRRLDRRNEKSPSGYS